MVLRSILLIFNVATLLFGIMPTVFGADNTATNWTIVIDAGHGGKDPGAVSGRIYEKNINLAVALELGRQLEAYDSRIRVVYTRSDDRFVGLSQRTSIANKAEADLFVSIHTNASPNKNVSGTETYVMGVDKNSANLAVSMRENGVISLESDYQSKYEGYDPQSSESLIIFSLMQYAYQTQSLTLAQGVEKAYAEQGFTSRSVRQAGFLVLWRAAMPSILTEIGFISNPEQLKVINSTDGQKKLARALALSIKKYIDKNPKGQIKLTDKSLDSQNDHRNKKNTSKEVKLSNELLYAVQIKSSTAPIEINSINFGPYVIKIRERKVKNIYKYYVESSKFYKDALLLQRKLIELYPDAFVVAFDRGEQISVAEAKKLTEK